MSNKKALDDVRYFPFMKLQIGSKAPDFKGQTQDNTIVTLGDFLGKKLVIFFYPKDNTPGCTKQVCNLRDHYQLLVDAGYSVIGVSNDSVASHKKFSEKNALPFPLIADTEQQMTKAYGIARMFWFPRRTSFLIDEKGYISRIISQVKVSEHVKQILS